MSSRAKAARGGVRSMNTGSSTQGSLFCIAVPTAISAASRRSASKVPRLTSSPCAPATNGPISSGDNVIEGTAAGRKQHVGREIRRHRVGDAVNPGSARPHTRENIGRGLRHAVARCCLRVMHLWSLRRHDPDQVRWVGLTPLSPANAGHPTRLLFNR